MRAMTWPFFTGELKSTKISLIRPETWLPTCTVTSAESVPVAVTRATMRPRSTRAPIRTGRRSSCATCSRTRAPRDEPDRQQPLRISSRARVFTAVNDYKARARDAARGARGFARRSGRPEPLLVTIA
jgi:hypothetical protein